MLDFDEDRMIVLANILMSVLILVQMWNHLAKCLPFLREVLKEVWCFLSRVIYRDLLAMGLNV